MSEARRPRLDPERLIELPRAATLAVAPSGTWAALAVARLDADRAKYVHDLWRIDLDDPARAPQQLTRGPANDRAPAFRHDGALAFLSNRNPREGKPEDGDEERAQIWVLPAEGGEPRPLTDEPLGVNAFRFAARADRLVYVAPVLPGVAHEEQRKTAAERAKHGPSALHYRSMPVRHWDHWIEPAAPHLIACAADGSGRRDLTPDADREHRELQFDVSADGARAVLTLETRSSDRLTDTSLLCIDLDSDARRILGQAQRTTLGDPHFSPDGTRIACVRNRRSLTSLGAEELCLLDASSGELRVLTQGWERIPVPWTWDERGEWLVVTADDAGTVPVFRVSADSGRVERVTELASGGSHDQLAWIPGANAITGLRHRLIHPPQPFRVPLEPDAKPWLLAGVSGFSADDGSALAQLESFSVPVPGSRPVQTFLLKPAAAPAEPLPTLLWIHGGPWNQWPDGWHWRWNPLVAVAAGYAVALPNPRGSTGVDQAFVDGAWGNTWGEGPYHDVMAVADALAVRPDLDPARTVAMGGSFGGYMTNWIGVNSARFRCLVTHASIFDFGAFHGVTDHPAFWELRMGGRTPWSSASEYDLHSPHGGIERWRTPVLVIHGERDYRVPIGEGLALFEAIERQGVPCELLVFPDENHWVLRPRNIVTWYRTWLDFVARWLGHDTERTH